MRSLIVISALATAVACTSTQGLDLYVQAPATDPGGILALTASAETAKVGQPVQLTLVGGPAVKWKVEVGDPGVERDTDFDTATLVLTPSVAGTYTVTATNTIGVSVSVKVTATT